MSLDWISLIVGIALFVVGIPLAYFIGRRNRQVPDLRTAVDFDRIVEPGDWLLQGDLTVVFDGATLNRVSRTYLAVWNQRGDTVRAADILPSDPLRIAVESDDEVLRARIVAFSRHQVAARVERSGEFTLVDFDFMDSRDGFVIEVLHRGSQPAALTGTLPGVTWRKPKQATLTREARAMARKSWPGRLVSLFKLGPSRAAVLLLAIFGAAAFAYIGVHNFVLWLSPETVPLDNFDLESLEGQREFAAEVTKGGNVDAFSGWLNLVYLGTSGIMIGLLSVVTRAVIPRGAVATEAHSMTTSRVQADTAIEE